MNRLVAAAALLCGASAALASYLCGSPNQIIGANGTNPVVSTEFGIDMEAAPAAHIDNWVSVLEEKETAIVTAAAAASKAVEWLCGAAAAEEADVDEAMLEAA
jgi:antirestriction protein ArdC